jgi:pimeloyl-ACP methyl ester carboxylesterase
MPSTTTHEVKGGGGIDLHVEETGNDRGQPILFIHGLSQCRLAWTRQLRSDLARDFRLVAMDLRGHGRSQKPRDAYAESRLWADDVNAVIQTLRLDRPFLCGSSYGGVVMTDYVKHYGEDGIAGTVWAGAISRLGPPLLEGGFIGGDFPALAPGLFSDSVAESVDALERLLRLCFHRQPSPEDFCLFLGYNVSVPPHVRQGLFSRELDNDAIVAAMRTPMLLAYGERDAIVLPAMGRHLARLAPHAKLSLYPNAGHLPFWEDADRFNRELRELHESGARSRARSAS